MLAGGGRGISRRIIMGGDDAESGDACLLLVDCGTKTAGQAHISAVTYSTSHISTQHRDVIWQRWIHRSFLSLNHMSHMVVLYKLHHRFAITSLQQTGYDFTVRHGCASAMNQISMLTSCPRWSSILTNYPTSTPLLQLQLLPLQATQPATQ